MWLSRSSLYHCSISPSPSSVIIYMDPFHSVALWLSSLCIFFLYLHIESFIAVGRSSSSLISADHFLASSWTCITFLGLSSTTSVCNWGNCAVLIMSSIEGKPFKRDRHISFPLPHSNTDNRKYFHARPNESRCWQKQNHFLCPARCFGASALTARVTGPWKNAG